MQNEITFGPLRKTRRGNLIRINGHNVQGHNVSLRRLALTDTWEIIFGREQYVDTTCTDIVAACDFTRDWLSMPENIAKII